MQDLPVDQEDAVDVDTPQVKASAAFLVEAYVEPRQGGHAPGVDLAVHDGDEFQVAHTQDVVACRQRPRDQQVGDPAELL